MILNFKNLYLYVILNTFIKCHDIAQQNTQKNISFKRETLLLSSILVNIAHPCRLL